MKIVLRILLLSGFLGAFAEAQAQEYYDYGFEKSYGVDVRDTSDTSLDKAWVGGMNNCQFSPIKLNNDEYDDLFVFDRHGDKILTFTNKGFKNEIGYEYAPEYEAYFPALHDWAILKDYNNDGKRDIFTYSLGGIRVFKNIGGHEPEFRLEVYPYIRSLQGSSYTNLFLTEVDYPAICDLDNDGDLDILTFWSLGTFVQEHINQSMEKYGTADSLDYIKTSDCWGYFAESEESNQIFMDTCINPVPLIPKNIEDERHTGSTFLVHDFDADDDKDLLLGDIDYPDLIYLTNGGTVDSARIVHQDTMFPGNTKKLNLYSFPVSNYIDVDNDGVMDLLVSPFDPLQDRSNHHESSWLYLNKGADNDPEFHYETNQFLQDEMLDFGAGASPVLFDYNRDGLMDLVVGNFGYLDSTYYNDAYTLQCEYRSQLALLENTGTPDDPSFKLIDADFGGLTEFMLQAIDPAFGDLDGDGDPDMLVGNAEGTIYSFENISSGRIATFELRSTRFLDIDVGHFSTPQLIDLTDNDLPDLVIGKRNGTISYYQNEGTPAKPAFTWVTDSLGGVDVRNPNLSYYGFSNPCFFRDQYDSLRLFVGSEFGHIFYYKNIEDNLAEGDFSLVEKMYLYIDEGDRSAIAIHDLNSDDYPDMILGNYRGGINYFQGSDPPPYGIEDYAVFKEIDVKLFPNPASEKLNIQIDGAENLKGRIQIIDMHGNVLKELDFVQNKTVKLDVSIYDRGIYICRFIITDGSRWIPVKNKKIVITKNP
ncbi:MAG: T9SS type A sorting domain-containing protein [Bacteroidales bacterium]|nr:T9SS type A sorting domain-containing protein [Bacteroidales bacterium]